MRMKHDAQFLKTQCTSNQWNGFNLRDLSRCANHPAAGRVALRNTTVLFHKLFHNAIFWNTQVHATDATLGKESETVPRHLSVPL